MTQTTQAARAFTTEQILKANMGAIDHGDMSFTCRVCNETLDYGDEGILCEKCDILYNVHERGQCPSPSIFICEIRQNYKGDDFVDNMQEIKFTKNIKHRWNDIYDIDDNRWISSDTFSDNDGSVTKLSAYIPKKYIRDVIADDPMPLRFCPYNWGADTTTWIWHCPDCKEEFISYCD